MNHNMSNFYIKAYQCQAAEYRSMKDILRRNNPQYNSVEGLLEKRTLGTPIQVSKPTGGSSLIPINDQKEISFDKITQIEHSVFKARYIKNRKGSSRPVRGVLILYICQRIPS